MNVMAAMLIGVAGTSVIHTSKGLMKLGMQQFQRAKLDERSTRAASLIYAVGILANFTTPFWVMFANLFAPTVIYTSMYGLGLVSLLAFSRFVLHETLTRFHALGIAIIILGTLLLGAAEIVRTPPSFSITELSPLVTLTGVWMFGALVVARLSAQREVRFQEVFFGLAAGGMAALDALLKGVAQHGENGARLIPSSAVLGAVLAGSFLVAAGAFGMIQWSYLRSCRASVMGTAYDLSYVGLPVLLFAVLKPEYGLTVLNIAGLAVLAAGALVVQAAGGGRAPWIMKRVSV